MSIDCGTCANNVRTMGQVRRIHGMIRVRSHTLELLKIKPEFRLLDGGGRSVVRRATVDVAVGSVDRRPTWIRECNRRQRADFFPSLGVSGSSHAAAAIGENSPVLYSTVVSTYCSRPFWKFVG